MSTNDKGSVDTAQQVLILRGLPASGKSTWAKQHVASHKDWKRVNKDDLRRMVDGGVWSKRNERTILSVRDAIIENFLFSGYSVIVDDTNFDEKHVKHIKELVKVLGLEMVPVEIKTFDTDPVECVTRNELRPEHERVPNRVIWDMYDRYVRPYEYETQSPALQDVNLSPCIICDLDGTLALLQDRSPYDCKKCGSDDLNKPVARALRDYVRGSQGTIVFFSGRSAECYEESRLWLDQHGFAAYPLYVRQPGDSRKDAHVKLDMYNRYIRGKYYVDYILDDRNQVVEMWRDTLYLPCFQVAPGDF
jgi:predicted kinase